MNEKRYIAHFDMDAFFAAIEERDNLRFQGLPIAVGADPAGGRGRGVVSTANYAARVYGIGSGQSIKQAWRMSQMAVKRGDPEVIFLPGSWRRYSAASKHIMETIQAFSSQVQQRSVDEAYVDISHVGSLAAAVALAKEIKQAIFEAEKLTVSVGVGPNKLIAKIASDFDKPDGLTVVDESQVQEFLSPLPVRAIPGIGPKTEERLKKRGINTVADLHACSQEVLEDTFGKWGSGLYLKARGIDSTPVMEERDRKSIGEQQTFLEDVSDPAIVITKIVEICKSVFASVERKGYGGARTVSITVRYYDFSTLSSAHTPKKGITSVRELEQVAIRLALPFLDKRRNPDKKPVRLVGVRLEKLQEKTLL